MKAQAPSLLAKHLVADGMGLLAIDESIKTCNKRFQETGIPQTEEARRAYRELLITAPGLNRMISGVILYDETIRQETSTGKRFVQILHEAGIVIGIKVDLGTKPYSNHPEELLTDGLDGLPDRLSRYYELGARFAKWRAVFTIANRLPSAACITANAEALALYAAHCQKSRMVPIVEPEVLMVGDHSLDRCQEVTSLILTQVFEHLRERGVVLEAMILKPNMILAGISSLHQPSDMLIAEATLRCLHQCVPAAVAGIVFLSGGQASRVATARLNAIHTYGSSDIARPPWPLTFSFGRALQQPAISLWAGLEKNRISAQTSLLQRARFNQLALHGAYRRDMDT